MATLKKNYLFNGLSLLIGKTALDYYGMGQKINYIFSLIWNQFEDTKAILLLNLNPYSLDVKYGTV